jgi:hypothetical protein
VDWCATHSNWRSALSTQHAALARSSKQTSIGRRTLRCRRLGLEANPGGSRRAACLHCRTVSHFLDLSMRLKILARLSRGTASRNSPVYPPPVYGGQPCALYAAGRGMGGKAQASAAPHRHLMDPMQVNEVLDFCLKRALHSLKGTRASQGEPASARTASCFVCFTPPQQMGTSQCP